MPSAYPRAENPAQRHEMLIMLEHVINQRCGLILAAAAAASGSSVHRRRRGHAHDDAHDRGDAHAHVHEKPDPRFIVNDTAYPISLPVFAKPCMFC